MHGTSTDFVPMDHDNDEYLVISQEAWLSRVVSALASTSSWSTNTILSRVLKNETVTKRWKPDHELIFRSTQINPIRGCPVLQENND